MPLNDHEQKILDEKFRNKPDLPMLPTLIATTKEESIATPSMEGIVGISTTKIGDAVRQSLKTHSEKNPKEGEI